MATNNVIRLLNTRKIPHTVFELANEKKGATEIAAILGYPESQVFKTIVIARENGKPLLCVVPGNQEVDLKLVASAVNQKKVRLTTQNEAESITGLLTGGISPLALIQKGFTSLIDRSALNFGEIIISGGQRGLFLLLSPSDLKNLTNGRFEQLATVNS